MPHRLRRLYSPIDPNEPDVPLTLGFTPESQAALINNFEGSFVGFQAGFESKSHRAIHRIVGGCVNLLPALWFRRSRTLRRDLSGTCPSDAPASCIPGPKWSPNGAPLISTYNVGYTILTFQ